MGANADAVTRKRLAALLFAVLLVGLVVTDWEAVFVQTTETLTLQYGLNGHTPEPTAVVYKLEKTPHFAWLGPSPSRESTRWSDYGTCYLWIEDRLGCARYNDDGTALEYEVWTKGGGLKSLGSALAPLSPREARAKIARAAEFVLDRHAAARSGLEGLSVSCRGTPRVKAR